MNDIFPVPFRAEYNREEYYVLEDCNSLMVANPEDLAGTDLFARLLELRWGIKLGEVRCESGNFPGTIKLERCKGVREGYSIRVDSSGVLVSAVDMNGGVFGMMTLLQLIDKGRIPFCFIEDSPRMNMRGVHVYLPEKNNIKGFKRIIDVFAYLKLNTLFIEVGGGMEYKRHPEINTGWEELCKNADSFPGGSPNLQGSDFYWKNSFHTELGGGSFISQEDVRDIVNYAKSLGFEVIPELQSLSHVYYMTAAHPDIAEIKEDPYPDTYCPMNEKSYSLYFELAEEVIDVFRPSMVSIGHDELRIMGICPKCKEKDGQDLLAMDINRLYDFYNNKGIKIAIWGEKLQIFTGFDGRVYGGNVIDEIDRYGRRWYMPETYKAVDKVPKDILILDWYHMLNRNTEKYFSRKGFSHIFGNFRGSLFADFEQRSGLYSLMGAEISTWCRADEHMLGINGLLYEISFSAAVLWQSDYCDANWKSYFERTISQMSGIREIARNAQNAFCSKRFGNMDVYYAGDDINSLCCIERTAININAVPQNIWWVISKLPDKVYGVEVDSNQLWVHINNRIGSLLFLHASSKKENHNWVSKWDSPILKRPAEYIVRYMDGTVVPIKIRYGVEVGAFDMDWSRQRRKSNEVTSDVDVVSEKRGENTVAPYYKIEDEWRDTLVYTTFPIVVEGYTIYAYEWENSYPKKEIEFFRPIHNTSCNLTQKVMLFAVIGCR